MCKEVFFKNFLRESLESCRRIRQSKRHFHKFVKTALRGTKTGFVPVFSCYWLSPITTGSINRRKISCVLQCIYRLSDPGKRIRVLRRYLVQLAIIYTQPVRFLFLGDHYNRITIATFTRDDDSFV